MNKYKTLVSNTALISIGTFASKILTFFMVRFYTGQMSPADYGTADLITTSAHLLIPIISLGITDAVFRFALDSHVPKKRVFSIGLFIITLGTLLFAVILPLISLSATLHDYLLLIAVFTMTSCYHSLCAQFIRAMGKTALYAGQGVLNTALVIGLNILFLSVLHMGITGYVLSVAIADLICTVFLVIKERLWRALTLHVRGTLLSQMLRYSVPLIPTTVFWWITSVSDRYMIDAFIGSDANGIYTVANKIPTLLTLIAGMFMEAWQFSAIKEKNGGRREHIRFYTKVWNVFFSAMFLISAVVIAFSKLEIGILADKSFFAAWQYVPLLCLAMMFCSFTSFTGSVYLVYKKSGLSFITSAVGAAVNIVLNIILIKSPLGIYGAALSTVISYFTVFVIRAVSTRRLIPFGLYPKRLILSTLVISALSVFITLEIKWYILWSALSVILLALINYKPLLSLVLGIFGSGKSSAEKK